MKLQLKAKLAAASLAVASVFAAAPAHALVGGGSNSGSLFLTVWDTAEGSNWSYAYDTGYTLNAFLPNGVTATAANGGPATGDKTPETGLTLTFNTDLLAAVALQSGVSLSTLAWNVVAADSLSSIGDNRRRLVTTTNNPTPGSLSTAGLLIVTNNVSSTANWFNSNDNLSDGLTDGSSAGASGTSNISTGAHPDTVSFGNTLGNGALSTSSTIGGVLNFLYLAGVGTNPSGTGLVNFELFGNDNGLATWTLGSDGTLTYSLAAPAAVPLPAAFWLFASGLLGMVGIGRRKSKAA